MNRRVAIAYPVDALVSFHYYRTDAQLAPLVNTGRLRLIGDSGAFSALTQGAAIDLGEYAQWVARWRAHLLWAASLDVIGDAAATWRNWTTLRERHDLATVPTLHAGCSTTWLDRYAAAGVDMIGLGGLVGTAPRAFRWAVHMFAYARRTHPQVRFHLWGVTNRQYLDNLPTWSADSSGIIGQAYRYGQLRIFDPRTATFHQAKLDGGRSVYRLGSLLRGTYGVDPASIDRSTPANRATLVQLTVASTQQYAAWLQRRHAVSPPSGAYVNHGAPISTAEPAGGPRGHATAGADHDLRRVVGDAALAGQPGPRLHAAGAQPGRTQDELMAAAGVQGPRLHAVDGAPGNVLMAAGEPGPPAHPRRGERRRGLHGDDR